MLAALCLAAGASGCAIIPGQDVYRMRATGESSVQLPVKADDGEGLIPEHVKVQEIDAQFVIAEHEKRVARKKEAYKPIPHRDYRIGRGDILSVTVFDHPELTTRNRSEPPCNGWGSKHGRD